MSRGVGWVLFFVGFVYSGVRFVEAGGLGGGRFEGVERTYRVVSQGEVFEGMRFVEHDRVNCVRFSKGGKSFVFGGSFMYVEE